VKSSSIERISWAQVWDHLQDRANFENEKAFDLLRGGHFEASRQPLLLAAIAGMLAAAIGAGLRT
jgi:hypothetical protein